MPSIINSDDGSVSGSAGLKVTSADDGILEIQNNGETAIKVSDSSLKVPTGNTAQRPASPENGMIRFNSDTGELEGYLGGAWKTVAGNEPALKLDFDEYQMDSRISFTRATNGTYFDSAGVLRTAGSGVARFDHRLESGTWVNKGLLIEEARTNVCLRSEEFQTTWVVENTSVSSNLSVAPDGTTTADSIIETGTTSVHAIRQESISIIAGSYVTASVFIKALGVGSSRYPRLQLNNSAGTNGARALFDVDNGTIALNPVNIGTGSGVTSSITDVGNGWYRCTCSTIIDASTTSIRFYMFMQNQKTAYTASYSGDNTSGVLLWGAQLEAGAFPTSYIKTTSASVTRNADQASMTGTNFSSWYNASEGTAFWQGDTVNTSTATGQNPRGWSISDNGTAERLAFSLGFEGNTRTFFVIDGSATQCNIFSPDPAVALVANQTYKAASAYKVNDFAHTLDGNSPGTDTSGTLPTVDRAYFGVNEAGVGGWLNGHIAKFYYWPTRQPNAKLVSLTQ